MKWGEYSNDVQFILQWTENNKTSNKSKTSLNTNVTIESPTKRDIQKSLTLNGNQIANIENVGVVKGVQQVRTVALEVKESSSLHNSPKKSSYSGSDLSDSPSHRSAPPYKDPPAPPPYRDPPPPTSSDKFKKNILQESNKCAKDREQSKNVMYNAQYRELIALINYQREKLTNQQADLTKVIFVKRQIFVNL